MIQYHQNVYYNVQLDTITIMADHVIFVTQLVRHVMTQYKIVLHASQGTIFISKDVGHNAPSGITNTNLQDNVINVTISVMSVYHKVNVQNV